MGNVQSGHELGDGGRRECLGDVFTLDKWVRVGNLGSRWELGEGYVKNSGRTDKGVVGLG